jgi:flagellin
MLQRMRDLKVQYKNEVLDDDDKAAIVAEAKALTSEIKDIQSKTEFNGIALHRRVRHRLSSRSAPTAARRSTSPRPT